MIIAVAGTGYVGLSNAILLAQNHEVYDIDILPEKVLMINEGKSPIKDKEIEEYLSEQKLNLTATMDGDSAYAKAEYIIIEQGGIIYELTLKEDSLYGHRVIHSFRGV